MGHAGGHLGSVQMVCGCQAGAVACEPARNAGLSWQPTHASLGGWGTGKGLRSTMCQRPSLCMGEQGRQTQSQWISSAWMCFKGAGTTG